MPEHGTQEWTDRLRGPRSPREGSLSSSDIEEAFEALETAIETLRGVPGYTARDVLYYAFELTKG